MGLVGLSKFRMLKDSVNSIENVTNWTFMPK